MGQHVGRAETGTLRFLILEANASTRSAGIGSHHWVLLLSDGVVLNWLPVANDYDHHDKMWFCLVIQTLGRRIDCLAEDGCIA